ncbi:Dihydrolipoamide dehydrogenase of pyruvate dehydrogenase complex [Candidatus Riesia pediculischaeffi PTSU]|uniref:Dihydrolipoyl dehydrogenase n=2 Tax=Candidatus Riesia pediculischaeffi TaxID=428411 RepID=A0A0C1S9L5_9ENTR|nr:Dihydrolipoamide dehydrogenase of pyruvate dehydrogenase complex [Candidatus Riesia pediculischaeffi PTSU]
MGDYMQSKFKTQVVVLGSGPAGYSSAFRCADLGLQTILVERFSKVGGVCLNVGCIPSKTLLNISKIIQESNWLFNSGILCMENKICVQKIRELKEKVVSRIANNLYKMICDRKIKFIQGNGKFISSNSIMVENEEEDCEISFENAIIATGSHPTKLPRTVDILDMDSDGNKKIWSSDQALEIREIPKSILVIGGGIIGLEIGTIYHTLGSKIDIVEVEERLLPMVEDEVSQFYMKDVSKKFNIMLNTRVTKILYNQKEISVIMKDRVNQDITKKYDKLLLAIGRTPNSDSINLDKIGISIDEKGFIKTNSQMKTNISHIYAVGDVAGSPMLAHKGMHEGHIAAEVIYGMNHYFDPYIIPSIAYTDPEIAWLGLTEEEAKRQNIVFETSTVPWGALGKAISSNHTNGMTKIIFDKKTKRILGGSIVGVNGGELIGEIGLAIEMGCSAEDIALTIHAHPTLYESIGMASKMFEGSITDLPNKKSMIYKEYENKKC